MTKKTMGALFSFCLLGACGGVATTDGQPPTFIKGDVGPTGPGGPSGPRGAAGTDGKSYETVTPNQMRGWQFASINTGSATIQTGQSVAWPYNFNDPGAGSAVLASGAGTGAGMGGKAYAGYSGLNYLPLSRLTGLAWRTLVPSPAPNLAATGPGYWNVYVYLGATGDIATNPLNYDNLVIDPAFFPEAGYAPLPDVWQKWVVTGDTKVRCRYQRLKVGPNPTDVCVKDAPYKLSDFWRYNPGAFIMPAWCSEIPYALPNGQACNPLSPVVNDLAPGISFMVGQLSGGTWADAKACYNGVVFTVDTAEQSFVFRGN